MEDHPATLAGLAACFAAEADFEVCGQTNSWREALELVRAQRPDAILLDLQLTDGTGWTECYTQGGTLTCKLSATGVCAGP